jgi:threonine/homoserine/homoserine lactone efflux protein
MPDPTRLLAFTAASLVLIAVPGPNLLYILTRSVGQGRRAGLASAIGVETGTLLHVTAAALGLSSLVAASAALFGVVRCAGAAYLITLGIRALRRPSGLDRSGDAAPLPLRRVYRDGVLVNVLNPKVAVFFLAFLPQFVTPRAAPAAARPQMLALGAVFFALALTLDVAYALAGGVVSTWLRRRPDLLRWQRHAVGAIYLGLGAYAALSGGHRQGDSPN